ncbi:hypothetical protein L484_017676 [Morus notabilis]|uniref:Uncharacterized protein n=1 Tax=Morus notabilis TaxID=981085 RepID=W9S8I3_9ROSA|nr:uncharacterized protein LOC21400664 [Morus notabilis]EXC31394.1 hypothetical protein L484_017676 [Morus notabilis]
MKREGRQHGMVRTYRILPTPLNPKPETQFVNRFDSPATAGLFTRVPSKPTNHSKFTGKCSQPRCNGCHLHPTCKAKDKTKGNQKLKSRDVVSNYKLLTWRVVDSRPGLNFSGVSATRIVDHMSSYHLHDHDLDGEEEEVGDYVKDPTVGFNPIQSGVEISNADRDDDQVDHGDDDEEMSFCDVGFVLEQVEGDDGWCLVGEM